MIDVDQTRIVLTGQAWLPGAGLVALRYKRGIVSRQYLSMTLYSLKTEGGRVVVTQWRTFLALFGTMALAGGCVGLYLLWRDALAITGTNFWVPLMICIGVIAGGIYLLSRPFRFEARFDSTGQKMANRTVLNGAGLSVGSILV